MMSNIIYSASSTSGSQSNFVKPNSQNDSRIFRIIGTSQINQNSNNKNLLKYTSTSIIVSTVALIAFSQLLKKRSQMMIAVSSVFAISMLCLYFSENINKIIKAKKNNINVFHESIQNILGSKKVLTPLAMGAIMVGLILLLPLVSSIINMGISAILLIIYSYLFYEHILKSEVKSNNLSVLDYITTALAFSVPISLVTSMFVSGYLASVLSFSSTMAISLIGLYSLGFNNNMNELGEISKKIYKLCGENKKILSAALVGVLLVGLLIINVLKPLFLVLFGIAVMLAFFSYFVNENLKTQANNIFTGVTQNIINSNN